MEVSRKAKRKLSQGSGSQGRWVHKSFSLRPLGFGCHLVTDAVIGKIRDELREVRNGMLHLMIHCPSCSLSLNENADPSVRDDLQEAMKRLVPDGKRKEDVAAVRWVWSSYPLLRRWCSACMTTSMNMHRVLQCVSRRMCAPACQRVPMH